MDRQTKVLYIIAAFGVLALTMDAAHQNPITMGIWGAAVIAFASPLYKPFQSRRLWLVLLVAAVAGSVADYAFRQALASPLMSDDGKFYVICGLIVAMCIGAVVTKKHVRV